MKIAPEPLDSPEGYPIHISQEESAEHNFRILSCSSKQQLAASAKKWFIPSEEKLPLLFFRRIFTGLRAQQQEQGLAAPSPEGSVAESEEARGRDEIDDCVPLEAFQRAFERLFFMLGDEEGFDAQLYDENGNGLVG